MVSLLTNAPGSLGLPYALLDQKQTPHVIEVGAKTLLLDGQPATITDTTREGICFQTQEGCFTFTPEQFWHAFVSAGPTVEDAALLLADALARWSAAQHLVQTLSTLLQPVPVPSSHDSFIQRALQAFDGSEETTLLLARILQQEPAVIVAWASRLGKHDAVPAPSPCACNGNHRLVVPVGLSSSSDGFTEGGAVPASGDAPHHNSEPGRHRTRFSKAQVEQIRSACAASDCLEDTVASLARQFQCPAKAVRSKISALGLLNKQKRHRVRETSEAEQAPPQEEDRWERDRGQTDGSGERGAQADE
jgi:hypothetical protein